RSSLLRLGVPELLDSERISEIPAIVSFSPAVAMFGGVTPDLGRADVDAVTALLVSRMNLSEGAALNALTLDRVGRPLGVPHEDGYAFAAELLDELAQPGNASFVDIG